MAKVNPIQIQKYLKGVDYPATKEDLINRAEEEGADDDILSMLDGLPDDEEFETPAAVSKALGHSE